MPTYDYRCSACEHRFEVFQSMTARVLRKCPECGKPKLERLIGTGAAVIFKGSGFYQTDYRKPGYGDASKKDSADAPSTAGEGTKAAPGPEAGKTAAKSDSKPS